MKNSGATLTKPRLAFQTVAGGRGRGERQKGAQRRIFRRRRPFDFNGGQTSGRGEADGKGGGRGGRGTEGRKVQ